MWTGMRFIRRAVATDAVMADRYHKRGSWTGQDGNRKPLAAPRVRLKSQRIVFILFCVWGHRYKYSQEKVLLMCFHWHHIILITVWACHEATTPEPTMRIYISLFPDFKTSYSVNLWVHLIIIIKCRGNHVIMQWGDSTFIGFHSSSPNLWRQPWLCFIRRPLWVMKMAKYKVEHTYTWINSYKRLNTK